MELRTTWLFAAAVLIAACDPGAPAEDDAGGSDAAIDGGGELLTHPVTVEVVIAASGAGRVVSSVPGIACGADCGESFAHGAHVVLTAEAAYRSSFDGWTGACSGRGACVLEVDDARAVGATFRGHRAVRLSETDRDPDVRLREDRLATDHALDFGGARSDAAIAPNSGVFYFEARRLTDQLGPYGPGVCTADYPLENALVGGSDQSFGVNVDGGINFAGAWAGGFEAALSEHYGFVVDYRGATPTVYFIANEPDGSGGARPAVLATRAMPAVTAPLHFLLAGMRRAVGPQIEANPGNDTTSFPFHYDPGAILRAAGHGELADALVLGWGDTYAGPANAAPILTVSPDAAVPAGTAVTVRATASDEDGDLTALVRWELLSTPHYAGRLRGEGSTFTFTPTAVGVHPARATVTDSIGRVSVATVFITVPGPVARRDSVVLARDARTGAGIELAPDGLRARWTGLGKMGIRANQSCYGCFWYFEAQRLVAPVNQGVGLVTGDGNLDPYSYADVPGSMSVNTVGGAWRDLIPQRSFDPANDHYGFAVDYRGVHPRVYVVVGGAVVQELYLDDVSTEIYPMLYGNPTDLSDPGEYDARINFGASPFAYDPAAALRAHGVDPAGLVVGWGG